MIPPDLAALQAGPAGGPAPPDPESSITSRDSGSPVDHIRTAILALQMYAEGTHDD
jgi:hypothetical protein